MKKIFLLSTFLLSSLGLFADTGATEIQKLTLRVEALEAILSWIKVLGIPLLGLTSIWAAYMWWKGIKDKVDKLIEADANKKIEEKAERIVQAKLKEYPFIQEYEVQQKIKQEHKILIIGSAPKDIGLLTQIDRLGFKRVQYMSILEDPSSAVKDIHLILFDNRKGELGQDQMDRIAERLKGQVYFFYLSSEGGPRWESAVKELGKMGFANSIGTLEQNIINHFKSLA